MTRDEPVEKVARETAAALLENIDACECSDCVEQASGHIVRALRLIVEECARVASGGYVDNEPDEYAHGRLDAAEAIRALLLEEPST